MKILFLTLVMGVAFLLVFSVLSDKSNILQTASLTNLVKASKKEALEVVNYKIQSGDAFVTILEKFNVPYEDAMLIIENSEDVYDFRKIKAGKILKLFFSDKLLRRIKYDINDEIVIVVNKVADGFQVNKEKIKYRIEQVKKEAIISTSLFVNASEVGIKDKTILELAEIFGWDIDFATDIRKSDSFVILYEERYRDEQLASPGKILAAKFENQGETYWAFYYKNPNGEEAYYNLNSKSLARQFLKSPLNYSYISSGFSYSRVNPVTKKVLPHRAIDYAAPRGTPVVATANGEVSYTGRGGQKGIYIKLRNGGIYTTEYAHLSRVAKGIKKGVKVKQGQIIGYVGSTGLSTGPHLHYVLTKNNSLVNPLTLKLPLGKPIEKEWQEDFNSKKIKLKRLLEN